MLSGSEFKQTLKALGMSQISFAERYGFGKRTVATWVTDGPPQYVCRILKDLRSITVSNAPEKEANRTNTALDAAFHGALSSLLTNGLEAGWTAIEISEASSRFLLEYLQHEETGRKFLVR